MDANTEGYDIPEGSSVRVQHIHTAPKNTCCCLCLSWCTPVLISRRGNMTGEKVLGKKFKRKKKKRLKEKISIINHKSCSLKKSQNSKLNFIRGLMFLLTMKFDAYLFLPLCASEDIRMPCVVQLTQASLCLTWNSLSQNWKGWREFPKLVRLHYASFINVIKLQSREFIPSVAIKM